jgi:hypothetical protein
MPTPRPTRRQLLIGTTALAALWPRFVWAGGKKVLIIGGSVIATAVGQRIEHGLDGEGLTVHRRGKSSSGLARPDFFDWQGEAKKLIAAKKPDATVVMMGGNDTQSLRTDSGWIKWGTDGWRPEYAARVGRLVDVLTPDGQSVCWVGLPMPRSTGYRRKLKTINDLVEETVRGREGVSFVSTWNILTNGGQYAATMKIGGKQQEVRGKDGIHLTVAGAKLLEDRIHDKVLAGLRVGA